MGPILDKKRGSARKGTAMGGPMGATGEGSESLCMERLANASEVVPLAPIKRPEADPWGGG